jgi:hypothetical protein
MDSVRKFEMADSELAFCCGFVVKNTEKYDKEGGLDLPLDLWIL